MARTAVMTGAAGKIGSGAVKRLAAMGINVVMVTHNQQVAEKISEECKDLPGEVVAMSNEGGDAAVFGDVYERFGSVDILIPNHGYPDRRKDISDITEEELTRKFHHQVLNTFEMIQKAVPFMEKAGSGRIILMSSAGAYDGNNKFPMVGAVVDGAVTSMMKWLAGDLADKNITVNCIIKGYLEEDHPPKFEDEGPEWEDIPAGRAATSEDFGNAVAFLAAEESSYITGQSISLAGGKIRF